MLFKKTMQKTKNFFMKSLQNLKKILFGSYENIPRTLFLNPLSCSSINQRSHHFDHIYPKLSTSNPSSVSDQGDQGNADRPTKQITDTDANNSNETTTDHHEIVKPLRNTQQATSTSTSTSSFRQTNGTAYLLAQKMIELEMMDTGDVDQNLDVEEALHYYSRLTCPVYVDIVNKFFMDMYADFHLPQPSIAISSSSRRLGPLAL